IVWALFRAFHACLQIERLRTTNYSRIPVVTDSRLGKTVTRARMKGFASLTLSGVSTSVRRLFAPSLRPKLLLRPDGSGPIGQRGVQSRGYNKLGFALRKDLLQCEPLTPPILIFPSPDLLKLFGTFQLADQELLFVWADPTLDQQGFDQTVRGEFGLWCFLHRIIAECTRDPMVAVWVHKNCQWLIWSGLVVLTASSHSRIVTPVGAGGPGAGRNL